MHLNNNFDEYVPKSKPQSFSNFKLSASYKVKLYQIIAT